MCLSKLPGCPAADGDAWSLILSPQDGTRYVMLSREDSEGASRCAGRMRGYCSELVWDAIFLSGQVEFPILPDRWRP